jgi:hypothetical protein
LERPDAQPIFSTRPASSIGRSCDEPNKGDAAL